MNNATRYHKIPLEKKFSRGILNDAEKLLKIAYDKKIIPYKELSSESLSGAFLISELREGNYISWENGNVEITPQGVKYLIENRIIKEQKIPEGSLGKLEKELIAA